MKTHNRINSKLLYLWIFILLLNSCHENIPNLTQINQNYTPTRSITSTMRPLTTPSARIQPTTARIISATSSIIAPLISPTYDNRNVIAFTGTSEDANNDEIYLVYVNNLVLINITQNPAIDRMPSWSPDGSQIAFLSNRNSENMQLFIMKPDGSGVQQITHDDLNLLHRPSWSPEGNRIVFDALEKDDSVSINIVDLQTHDINPLLFDSNHNLRPAWSPDGKLVAFMSDRDIAKQGYVHIYILDLSSMKIRQLTEDPSNDSSPAWSPDGKQIAFSRDTGNRVPFICTINKDGSDLLMLLSENPELGGKSPSWSGDGKMIAFQDLRPVETGPILDWLNSVFVESIFIMNSDGSGTKRLTFGNLLAQYPDWKP